MYPVLFSIGPFQLHTYGSMIAIGFLVAVSVIRRLAARAKLPIDAVLDLTFWCLVVGFVGSRIAFVITRWNEQFSHDLLGIFKVWEGGLVFLGGPIAAMPFMVWFIRRKKLPVWKTMDAMIPGLAIAQVFGRFGCVAAGCCYGRPTGTNFGFKFDSLLVEASMRGIPLHPVQLYEAFSVLVLFFGLLWVFRKKVFDGQVILTYFISYPIIRSIVETFRGDTIRGFIIEDWLSTSQFISIWIFLAASLTLAYRLKQLKNSKGHS